MATNKPSRTNRTAEQEKVAQGLTDILEGRADAEEVIEEVAPKPKRTRGSKSSTPAPKPKAAKVEQPAPKPKEEPKAIGVRQLAEHLGTEPQTLRAFLRRSKRSVGRGTRYEWKSLSDPDAKKVIAEWKAAQEKNPETPAEF